MAKPKNRSRWQVKLAGQDPQTFRLESEARAFLGSHGITDPTKLPRGSFKQLEKSFEAQVIRKDKQGTVVRRSQTFDTYAEAEKFVAEQDTELDLILQTQGGFEVGYETVTVKEALVRFHREHYKGKASFKENGHRIEHLAEWLGANRKFRELTTRDFKALRKSLQAHPYRSLCSYPTERKNCSTRIT